MADIEEQPVEIKETKYGSSKPISESELQQARASLRLLKIKIQRYDEESKMTQEAKFKPIHTPSVLPLESANSSIRKSVAKEPKNNAKNTQSGFSKYNFEESEDAFEDAALNLEQCPNCNRTFAPEVLQKHINVCKNAPTLKRKPTEKKAKGSSQPVSTDNKWKSQSEQFRAHMKAAKLADAGDTEAANEAMKQAAELAEASLTPCPHCNRKFNEDAAKRHIPLCEKKAKEAQYKQGPPKRGRK